MSNAIFIITVGARDVKINREAAVELLGKKAGNLFDRESFKARVGSAYLLAQLKKSSAESKPGEKLRAAIKIEIVRPALNYLVEENMLEDIRSVVFVATDQGEDVEDRFRSRDTVHSAKLLEYLLKEAYSFNESCTFDHQLVSKEVNSSEFNNDLFSDYVHSLKAGYPPYDKVILLNQGGIDAINQPLLLNCLNLFGESLIQLTVSEESETCRPSGYPGKYLRERSTFQASNLLKSYNYAAIKQLKGLPANVHHLASVMDARLGFDFERARHQAGKIDARSLRKQLIEEIEAISTDEGKIKELYRNAKVKLDNESYVDFLLRIFRYTEEITRRAVTRLTRLDGNVGGNKWKEQIEKLRREGTHEDLFKETAKQKLPNGLPVDISFPGNPSYVAIWAYYEPKESKPFSVALILSEMRNRSIGAHDLNPVSRRIIDEALKPSSFTLDTLMSELDSFALGGKKDQIGFDVMNERIQLMLDEG